MSEKSVIKMKIKPKRIIPEGYYFWFDQISGDAAIHSIKSNKDLKVSIWTDHRTGYQRKRTHITINGKTLNYKVHRLIALYFIPNPKNLPIVDHINGDSLDNRLENLRWATKSQNDHNRKNAKGYQKVGKKYRIRIMKEGVTYEGKLCSSEEEAKIEAKRLSEELFPSVKY